MDRKGFTRKVLAMKFGDILDQWDNNKKNPDKKNDELNKMINSYLPDEDVIKSKSDDYERSKFYSQRIINNLKHEASCDLHGLSLSEAKKKVNKFLINASKNGYEKVLIIHGKGNHSMNNPVLRKGIQQYIQNHKLAGRWGVADKKNGGTGAIWVLLRYRSR